MTNNPQASLVFGGYSCFGSRILNFAVFRVMSPRANKSKGEVVVNDSPVDCQSRRADRSIFSAEKIQDRWWGPASTAKKKDTIKVVSFLCLCQKGHNFV